MRTADFRTPPVSVQVLKGRVHSQNYSVILFIRFFYVEFYFNVCFYETFNDNLFTRVDQTGPSLWFMSACFFYCYFLQCLGILHVLFDLQGF